MDLEFAKLPASLRRRIDRAFDAACGEDNGGGAGHPQKIRRVQDFSPNTLTTETHAGFVLDDVDDQAGGFLVGDDDKPLVDTAGTSSSSRKPTHIPLSRIPAALQLLDLRPDDAQVLAVFRNAASGWASRIVSDLPEGSLADQDDLQMVDRDDWRSVCAVLLEPNKPTGRDQYPEPNIDEERSEMDLDDGADSGSDEYVYENEPLDQESSADDGKSDDDYVEGRDSSRRPAVNTRSSRKGIRSGSSPPLSNDSPRKLTSKQTHECRRAFALFFPEIDVDSEELGKKRIMVQDISRVANLLKEKIKAEEIVEMLEAFSSSNDMSMNLGDFERMMITAKMA